jgi:LytS/YehU family sensor histidine kinase
MRDTRHSRAPGAARLPETRRRRWATPAAIAGIWAVPALITATQRYLAYATEPEYRIGWLQALAWQAPTWGLWALATPLILWLGRRFPLERGRRARALAIHFLLLVVLVASTAAATSWGTLRIFPKTPQAVTFGRLFLINASGMIVFNLTLYATVLGVAHAFEYYRRFREREVVAAQLAAQLAEAQLHALRMQLNPHFLFNALNAVSMLVRTGKDGAAVRMIAGLSDLLRLTLEGGEAHEVKLEEELDFLRRYLEIERIRFGERLVVRIDATPDLLDAHVPSLILQPLVENAIRHGIAPRASAGVLEIRARRDGALLELTVRDDGPGLVTGWSLERTGVGLANTRARLEKLYAEHHRLELIPAEGGGTMARVEIPFRLTPVAWEGPR